MSKLEIVLKKREDRAKAKKAAPKESGTPIRRMSASQLFRSAMLAKTNRAAFYAT